MAKSSNPVDAHRKAQRKQELKRNKQKREHTREISTVKKDTRPIEAEIRQLSQQAQKGPLSKDDKDQLAHLKSELARINKAKHEYVEAHPEHRKYVFPERPEDAARNQQDADSTPGLYDKNGRLKHPERSLYYDPVFNPYGAPPPGMPYREKPEYALARMGPTPEEIAAFRPVGAEDSDDEEDEDDDDDDDDDIAMPAGPPPGAARAGDQAMQDKADSSDESSDSEDDEDDIPLPPGPPPPRPNQPSSSFAGPARHTVAIARPSGFPSHQQQPHSLPPRPNFQPPPPPPLPAAGRPPHHGPKNPRLPARPPPPGPHMFDPLNTDGGPNRAFQQGGQVRGSFGPVLPQGGMPPPPPPPPQLPPAPSGPSPFFAVPGAQPAAVAPATPFSAHPIASAGATISAAPQLRDLKKEATAFVPLAMRKKMKQQQATLAKAGLSSINAARGATSDEGTGSGGGGEEVEGGEEGGAAPQRKRTLMDEMRERGIGAPGAAVRGPSQAAGGNASSKDDAQVDDYERFREEMADLL